MLTVGSSCHSKGHRKEVGIIRVYKFTGGALWNLNSDLWEGGPAYSSIYTQMPGANVSEEGTKRLFGIINEVKNNVILF